MTDMFDGTTEDKTIEPAPTPVLVDDKPKDEMAILAKRLNDKDAYIEQLKMEAAEARATVAEVDELKNELRRLKAPAPRTEGNTNPALTEEAIETLVANAITKKEATRTATENVNAAKAELMRIHGTIEKAKEALAAAVVETGLSSESLTAIASNSPTAFLKLVTGKGPSGEIKTFDKKSSVIPEAYSGSGPKPGTKEYFDQIRKEQGNKVYFTPAIQNQIFAARKAGTYKI